MSQNSFRRAKSTTGYSSYGYSPIKSVEREIRNLKHENSVVYQPIIKNYDNALSRVTYEEEKQIQSIDSVENIFLGFVKTKFRVLKDMISAKYSESHKSLTKKRQNVIRQQKRLLEFCRRNEDKCKRDPDNFDENEFLQQAESSKREGRRTAAEESVIAINGIELEEITEVISDHKAALKSVVDAMNIENMYRVQEREYRLRARINTPPKTETYNTTSTPSQKSSNTPIVSSLRCSENQKAMKPVPPSRCVSAPPLHRRRCRVKAKTPTLSSALPTKHVKEIPVAVHIKEHKPCAQISPMNSNMAVHLERPYGVDVLNDGTHVVVETDSLRFLDKDTGDVVRNISLYINCDEAKITGCFDVTVLQNDDVIVSDSHRKVLLRLAAGTNQPEIFLEVKDMLPKGIANDGEILYVCDAEQGFVQKIDIASRECRGHISLDICSIVSRASNPLRPHPSNVAINSQGEILVSDSLNSILYFIDRIGNVRKLKEDRSVPFSRPTGVSWLNDTQFVVAVQDTKCHQLVVVDVTMEEPIGTFGGKGCGENEFDSPQGLIVSKDRVLVCDLMNSRLQNIPMTCIMDFHI